MNVWQLGLGKSAKITRVSAGGGAAARLYSLGFVCGSTVTVLGYSLLKSSVLLGCGAVRLAVRKSLALKIEVEA